MQQQVLENNPPGIEVGPDAVKFRLSDNDLVSSSHKEVVRLQAELDRARREVEAAAIRAGSSEKSRDAAESKEKPTPPMQELRRQVRIRWS